MNNMQCLNILRKTRDCYYENNIKLRRLGHTPAGSIITMPIKYPCATCQKPCKSNQISISRDLCNLWIHLKCTTLSNKDFQSLGTSNEPYYCKNCYESIFSFYNLKNGDFANEHSSNQQKRTPKNVNLLEIRQRDTDCYLESSDFYNQYKNNNDFFLIPINI